VSELIEIARRKSDDELFEHGGQEGSEMAYRHDQEIRRRAFALAQEVGRAQKRAANWQMWSAFAVALSVVVTALGIWFDVIGLTVQ
jgi:hypothetical protein